MHFGPASESGEEKTVLWVDTYLDGDASKAVRQ